MDVSSLLNHHSPTSPLSSLPTKTSRQQEDGEDEGIKPLLTPGTPIQARSPALPKAKSKSKPKSESKHKSKSRSKSKPNPVPTRSEKPPKKTKAKGSTPPDPKSRPWTIDDKIVLFNIVSSRGASIKHFEGAIEGRSGLAYYIRWKHAILRGIRSSLVEEGNYEKKAGVKAVKAKQVKERYKRNAALKVKVEGD